MIKKYLLTLSSLFILTFTYCSTDKDVFSEKPPIDTNKPPGHHDEGFTLLPKNHVSDSDVYGEGEILQNQSSNPKFMLSTRKWQGIPSIGKDTLGNLYAGWISGGSGESNENYLTISLSKDKGMSWSHDKLILSVNSQDSTRMKDPNFFNDKFGNLYMYWGKHVQKKSVTAKEWAVTWYSKLSLSSDGNTIYYSPPRRIAEGIILNKLFYSSISDEVVFPIARWYSDKGDPEKDQAFLYKANYGAKYLNNFSKVGFIPVDVSLMGIYEHMIVQLKDSTYLGMMRTENGIYYSKSKDGNIWDKATKFTDLGATTSSRFYLGKLNSGRLIFVFNNSKNRSNMTVCLSEDDGITWPYKILIDDAAYITYPDVIETEPGILNIVYDSFRFTHGDIVFVKIKEEDIINKNIPIFSKSKISSIK